MMDGSYVSLMMMTMTMVDLPDEMWLEIATRSRRSEIASLRRTCKSMREILRGYGNINEPTCGVCCGTAKVSPFGAILSGHLECLEKILDKISWNTPRAYLIAAELGFTAAVEILYPVYMVNQCTSIGALKLSIENRHEETGLLIHKSHLPADYTDRDLSNLAKKHGLHTLASCLHPFKPILTYDTIRKRFYNVMWPKNKQFLGTQLTHPSGKIYYEVTPSRESMSIPNPIVLNRRRTHTWGKH